MPIPITLYPHPVRRPTPTDPSSSDAAVLTPPFNQANANEQDSALIYAEQYLRSRPGGGNIPSTTIRQGNETKLFMELFSGVQLLLATMHRAQQLRTHQACL